MSPGDIREYLDLFFWFLKMSLKELKTEIFKCVEGQGPAGTQVQNNLKPLQKVLKKATSHVIQVCAKSLAK